MKPKEYDAFISYAIEDKIKVAHDLFIRLEKRGLSIWYANNELRVGESLEQTIQEGMAKSRFGIIIITPHYLKKNWTRKELYSFWSREQQNQKVILPVFHGVTLAEVKEFDPVLADRWALSTEKGIEKIVDELVEEITTTQDILQQTSKTSIKRRNTFLAILLLLITGIFIWSYVKKDPPSEKRVMNLVQKRVDSFQSLIEERWQAQKAHDNTQLISQEKASEFYESWQNLEAQYRNSYEFSNGIQKIQFRKNVEPILERNLDEWSPKTGYDLLYPNILETIWIDDRTEKQVELLFFNTQAVESDVIETSWDGEFYNVTVEFQNPIRLINTTFTFAQKTNFRKHTDQRIMGLKPVEVFQFVEQNEEWVLNDIN